MEEDELRKYFIELVEEYNSSIINKIFERLYKVHRGNLINILRAWKEELDRMYAIK